MVEEQLLRLSAKNTLDGGDALALMQLLQEQTTPILSLRSSGSSIATSSERHRAGNPSGYDKGAKMERRRAREPVGRGRNPSRGASPKRALFGGQSASPSAPPLDVNSLEEFPPMEPRANTTNRLHTLEWRKIAKISHL